MNHPPTPCGYTVTYDGNRIECARPAVRTLTVQDRVAPTLYATLHFHRCAVHGLPTDADATVTATTEGATS